MSTRIPTPTVYTYPHFISEKFCNRKKILTTHTNTAHALYVWQGWSICLKINGSMCTVFNVLYFFGKVKRPNNENFRKFVFGKFVKYSIFSKNGMYGKLTKIFFFMRYPGSNTFFKQVVLHMHHYFFRISQWNHRIISGHL